jgi:hypothetical protein
MQNPPRVHESPSRKSLLPLAAESRTEGDAAPACPAPACPAPACPAPAAAAMGRGALAVAADAAGTEIANAAPITAEHQMIPRCSLTVHPSSDPDSRA